VPFVSATRIREVELEPPGETLLALVAHDAKKDQLLRLARAHRSTLKDLRLIATGTTGRVLSFELDLPVATNTASAEILLAFLADHVRLQSAGREVR
jgi:methylglyoxal synthase